VYIIWKRLARRCARYGYRNTTLVGRRQSVPPGEPFLVQHAARADVRAIAVAAEDFFEKTATDNINKARLRAQSSIAVHP
jgi:hypothetical protein